MSFRFFRAAGPQEYDSVRLALDAAWGLPSSGQQTCFSPASSALRDASGRPVLAVRSEFCSYSPADTLLSQVMSIGVVEEISRQEYVACMPVLVMPQRSQAV